MRKRRRITGFAIPAILAVLFMCLTGCGHVKSAKQLTRLAKREHGSCKVISKNESDEKVTVVLQDKLQGFQYTMTSRMFTLTIDGSSFGSLPETGDGFEKGLKEYALEQAKSGLDQIASRYDASYEAGYGEVLAVFTLPNGKKEETAVKIVEEAAGVFQELNLKKRMDGWIVQAEYDQDWLNDKLAKGELSKELDPDAVSSPGGSAVARHIGSARLPECSFLDKDKEDKDEFTDYAKGFCSAAEYLRKEEKTLADTGLSPDRIDRQFAHLYPQKSSDPVTFYYFSVNDKEFYVCDCINRETGQWVTNYQEAISPRDAKEARKKQGRFHVHINID